MKKTLLALWLSCLSFALLAQDQASPLLFIYDGSGSMWGPMDGKTKKEIAASVLASTVQALPEDQRVGVMAYGHRAQGDCSDIEFLVDLSNRSKTAVIDAVDQINPTGKTPLASSTRLAFEALQERNTQATIILITDGLESCDGDLCATIAQAKTAGLSFKMHLVGFGLQEGEGEELRCAARVGGGRYFDAGDAAGLAEVLTEATTDSVDEPKANFSLYATKNGQAVDAWVRARRQGSQEEVDARRTYRDTARLYLPPGSYDVDIQPLENSDVLATTIVVDIQEEEHHHREVPFDSGILEVTTLNNSEGWDAMVKVLHSRTGKQAAAGRTYGRPLDLEVDPGVYDVQLQLLEVKGMATSHSMEQVTVQANTTTTLRHAFASGIASIGVQTQSGELIDAAVHISDQATGTNVDGGRTYTASSSNPRAFRLSPGTYQVRIVTLGAHQGHTETLSVTVKAGETFEKILTY